MTTGVAVFFTGLPGAGKTTLARRLCAQFTDLGHRDVVLLDGDEVRARYQTPLGFSPADRRRHIAHVASLADEVSRRGGVAICALVAPYDDARRDARRTIETGGRFFLVHVSTPIAVCEQRDPKRLYARARAGLIQDFTGISAPYEVPTDADVTVDTSILDEHEAVARILHAIRLPVER